MASEHDVAAVRRYFDTTTNERVTDERIVDTLDWFKRDSQRHMLAARAIFRSLRPAPSHLAPTDTQPAAGDDSIGPLADERGQP